MKKLFKVRQSGKSGSLQVTFPAIWVDAVGLKPGDQVLIHMADDRLVIMPLNKKEDTNELN